MITVAHTRVGMQHLTITTGHTRLSFRDEVDDLTVAYLAPTLTPGEHTMVSPSGPVTVHVQQPTDDWAIVAIGPPDGGQAFARMAVVASETAAAELWPVIGHGQANRPTEVPWCAVELGAGLLEQPDAASWLGDWERCWAWAWLDENRKAQP